MEEVDLKEVAKYREEELSLTLTGVDIEFIMQALEDVAYISSLGFLTWDDPEEARDYIVQLYKKLDDVLYQQDVEHGTISPAE